MGEPLPRDTEARQDLRQKRKETPEEEQLNREGPKEKCETGRQREEKGRVCRTELEAGQGEGLPAETEQEMHTVTKQGEVKTAEKRNRLCRNIKQSSTLSPSP